MSTSHDVRRLLSPMLALGMIASFLVVAGVAKPTGTAWSNPITASMIDAASVDVDCPAPVQPAGVNSTFTIDDSSHLMWIKADSTRWDDTYVMAANIDMGTCVWSSPIAQWASPFVPFSGIFDGRGFQISNLSVAVNTASVDDSEVDVAGFIGYLDGSGQLRDTVFRNALVTFDDTNSFDDSTLNQKESKVAIAVGSRGPLATVEGVHVMYSIVRATMANAALPSDRVRSSFVGGVIGNSGGGVVSDLQTTGNVLDNLNDQAGTDSRGFTGGIIGRNEASTSGLQSSDDSIFTRAVPGSLAGGLIGSHSSGVVTESAVISPRVSAVATQFALAGGAFGEKASAGASGIRVTGGSVRSDGGDDLTIAGGVMGRSLGGGYSIDVHSTGTTVTATGPEEAYAGGVIGEGGDDTASQLSSNATVSALHAGTPGEPSVLAGGLIGLHARGILLNSFATGVATASSDDTADVNAGGLVGWSLSGTIQHVYATGNATATSTLGGSATAGGLIGEVGSTAVENAYSTGIPSAAAPATGTTPTAGGLLGVSTGDDTDSFFNTTTSGVTTSAGGIGLTTAQVQSGVSPIDTWGVVEGWQGQTFAGSPPLATAPFWGQCTVNSGFPFLLWQFVADPCSVDPPSPPPAVPSGPPLNVSAVAGDASVSVAWQAPVASGSFPVSSYQVQGSPSGTCLATAPARTCEITGLTNDVAYIFEVRALTGAGWGAWSLASNAVTPQPVVSPSIVISGSRGDVRGKTGIIVTGVTQGFEMGAILRPWVRLPGQTTFTQGSARVLVDESGDVTWQRRVGKRVTVYLATTDGSVKSKRITIPRSGG